MCHNACHRAQQLKRFPHDLCDLCFLFPGCYEFRLRSYLGHKSQCKLLGQLFHCSSRQR